RKFMRIAAPLRLLAAALAAATLLAGCGGGSGSDGNSAPKPVAEGVYFGLYTPSDHSTPIPLLGAIAPGDYAWFGDIHGTQYLLPNRIEAGAFAGSVTAWAPYG